MPDFPLPDWSRIDVVCLDMDGTVLDLHFDNLFWLEVLPRRWGAARGLDYDAAMTQLKPRFDAKRGTLDWYCVDHWSEELGLDIPALKHELREEIRYLDGAAEFLDLLRGLGKRVLLTTNAHPLSLRVKDSQTQLSRHFDELVSSHEFGVPKEHPGSGRSLRAGTTCRSPGRCSWTTARPCCRQRTGRRCVGFTRCCSRTRRVRRIPRSMASPGCAGWQTCAIRSWLSSRQARGRNRRRPEVRQAPSPCGAPERPRPPRRRRFFGAPSAPAPACPAPSPAFAGRGPG